MKRWLLAMLLGLAAAWPAWGANKTQVRLVLSQKTARPGETVWAGLEMTMPAPWHTYWRNGGDAGSPTTIEWQLPKGVAAGEIQWPVPNKVVDKISDETTLVTYVYSNSVVLLVPLKLDASVAAGKLEISGAAHWQECADICVMAHDDVAATLTVGSQDEASPDAGLIEQWRKKLPAPITTAPVSVAWEGSPKGETRILLIEWKTNASPADFYPFGDTNADIQGITQSLPGTDETQLRKVVKKSDAAAPWPARLAGILVGKAGTKEEFAAEIDEPILAGVPAAGPAGVKEVVSPQSLWVMLGFALLGGLILNIMPCVLPVIALKILGFVNQSKEHPRRVRQLGLVYGLGVLASFLTLAALAIGVQRAGGIATWGDAIRHPQFQLIITVLITLVALNLFGVFEIALGGRTMGAATELASRHGFAGAFFNGVLATILATPCTAPFLGAALAFAFTQPPAVIVLVFLTVGFGLALPFVAICVQPGLLRFLPKPGAWMVRFKTAMGFPMMGTAVWLMWVSAKNEDELLALGLFLVTVALAAWIWGEFVQRSFSRRGWGVAAAITVLLLGYFGVLRHGRDRIDWKPWSEEAVTEARREGHPVLVDFTAKSCVNCIANKARAIEIDATRAKLKAINAVAFEADFTYENPTIAEELRKFDRPGVPLVLVYPKDLSKPPEELPAWLSPSIVLDALSKAAN